MPKYAVVCVETLERIERTLADDTDAARNELDEAFARFERTQPELADHVGQVLSKPLDETALALGYFLSIAIWLAFERAFGSRLREVSADALQATVTAVALEEELRAAHGEEPLDLDDVVAIEQPNILAFVHEHLDAALDVTAKSGEPGAEPEREIDVDDVHVVYRAILVLTLSLSHAVAPSDGARRDNVELLA